MTTRNVEHLWNVTNYLRKLEGKAANSFMTYCIQKCRQTLAPIEPLPKSHFGSSIMCSYCGSVWSKNENHIRIDPGRACSKSVKQIIRATTYNSVSRFRATLLKKSLKNQMNKVVIRCSVCSKKTVINCKKPERPKPDIKEVDETLMSTPGNVSSSQKKKKKRKKKDKTAGLNISNNQSTRISKKGTGSLNSTPVIRIKQQERELTPLQRVRKINLHKLSNLLNESKEKSRNSISSFLEELY
ncbi:uncharacterized protein LOC106635689 [Copidosoma floridanum]|uniref:uncharacterized protein LOC106635689 n=1 Tax=Copidosoma floridanum TaxID=29053 RepID=UPI0006C9ABDA|nr:uncharacterized protein LOC106635689 [Copidosoma floridanum]